MLITAQYVKYIKTTTPLPNINIGNITTNKEANATANVPPNTMIALITTTKEELETKAATTINGMKPRRIKMTRKRELSGWF